jgi:hypothetical protein
MAPAPPRAPCAGSRPVSPSPPGRAPRPGAGGGGGSPPPGRPCVPRGRRGTRARPSVIMFSASQARFPSRFRSQWASLCRRRLSRVLVRQPGMVRASLVTRRPPRCRAGRGPRCPRARSAFARRQGLSRLPLAVHDAAPVVGDPIGHHQRVGHGRTVKPQPGHDGGDQSQAQRLVRAPGLAGGAAEHGLLDPHEEGEEVGAAAVGRRPVLGARPGRRPRGSWAMEKSQAMRSPGLPRCACRSTRQITGLSQCRMAVTMSLNRRMYWRYSSGRPA